MTQHNEGDTSEPQYISYNNSWGAPVPMPVEDANLDGEGISHYNLPFDIVIEEEGAFSLFKRGLECDRLKKNV